MMRARSGVAGLCCWLGVVSIAFSVASVTTSPALAAGQHGLTGTFGGPSTTQPDPEPLSSPTDVAVNEATGTVYVTDSSNNRVEYFTATGEYLGQFNGEAAPSGTLSSPTAIAVDNSGNSLDPSAGDVYVVDSAHSVIDKFSATGEYLSQLTEAGGVPFKTLLGVAADPQGNVWVYQQDPGAEEKGEVARFDDSDDFVAIFATNRKSSFGLAVDSSDNVYVATGIQNAIAYSSTGTELHAVNESEHVTGLTSDGTKVYVDQGTLIAEYGASGEPLIEEFGSGQLSGGEGLTVNAGSSTVYVAEPANSDVEIYSLGEAPEPPHPINASGVGAVAATLRGELNPGGVGGRLGYQFVYNTGPSCIGGQRAPEPAGEVAEAKNALVDLEVTGLQPNTLYTYCLVATNGFGPTTSSEEVSFTTLAQAPTVTGAVSQGITQTGASLGAQIDPNNELSHWHVEYSTSQALSGAASLPNPEGEIPPGTGDVGVSQQLNSLLPNTVYFWRVVANNTGGGTELGAIESFLTRPATPTTEPASQVSDTEATFNGSFNPGGEPDHFYFEYGTAPCAPASCPNQTSVEGPVSGASAIPATATQALSPFVTYHYRIVVENATGPSYGPAMQVTTLPQPPRAITDPPSSIDAGSVVFAGEVVPQCVEGRYPATTYHFEYGTSVAYGSTSEVATVASASCATGGEAVSVALGGLLPNTAYHYRLDAENGGGETQGIDRSFITNAAGGSIAVSPPSGFSLTGVAPAEAAPAAFPNLTALAPTPPVSVKPVAGSQTTTAPSKLSKALRACKKDKRRTKRVRCEKQARKRYGAKSKAKK